MQLPWLIIASLGSISMLFTIISLATTAWVVAGLEGVGLWQACTDSICIAIPSNVVTPSLWVTRIFMMLSLGNTLAATLFALYGAIKEEACNTSLKVGGNFIGAAIFLLVSMSVFTGNNSAASNFWGYSFGLGWTAACLSIALTVVSFAMRTQEK